MTRMPTVPTSDLVTALPAPTGKPVRMVVLASLGGALEFYDFVAYGIFAIYIADAFFPARNQLASFASAFAVFAGGYLIRPLGGCRLQQFRRSSRAAFRLPGLSDGHFAGDDRDGLVPYLRDLGRLGDSHIRDATAVAGFLPRRRTARRHHLRIQSRDAGPGRAGMRPSILLCVPGRRAGERRQRGIAQPDASASRRRVWLAAGLCPRRTAWAAELLATQAIGRVSCVHGLT